MGDDDWLRAFPTNCSRKLRNIPSISLYVYIFEFNSRGGCISYGLKTACECSRLEGRTCNVKGEQDLLRDNNFPSHADIKSVCQKHLYMGGGDTYVFTCG